MGRGDEPGWNVAQRFRLQAEELREVRAEIHEILRERGRTACTWEVGSQRDAAATSSSGCTLSGLVDDAPTRWRSGWC